MQENAKIALISLLLGGPFFMGHPVARKKIYEEEQNKFLCLSTIVTTKHTYRVEFNCADLVNSMLSKSPSSSLNFDVFSNRFIHAAKSGGIVASQHLLSFI